MSNTLHFWLQTPLREMNTTQWEQLCDGCGLCCLNKLEDEDTGDIYLTRVACNLLDKCSAQCSDYENRLSLAPDCIQITPELAETAEWLPNTCAYKQLAHGEPLLPWHPLISGREESPYEANRSISGKVIHESELGEREHEEFIITEEELTSSICYGN
ncbi:UPF0260 protein YcgN [hydrothermal vent metagenome]|uniref:UPF0260 protein YcgN n=1 Tax=hydrothermal vent metagenome TaxID=652676 RepID=A0A3B0ZJG0_9ZZZZ